MVTLIEVQSAEDLAAVVDLCWAYRDFLMTVSGTDLRIVETFYPVPKYQALMAELAQIHARPKGIILLARDEAGQALGCGMTHALDAETSEIKRVYVTDAARGRGVAAQICEALVDQARADGFRRVVLDTSKSLTAAQRLYDKLGFAARGPYQPLPEETLPHLLFFEKQLGVAEA